MLSLLFSKAFDIISREIIIDKLRKYRLDEQTVRWTVNCLSSLVQRVVVRASLAGSSSVHSNTRETWSCWRNSIRGPQR